MSEHSGHALEPLRNDQDFALCRGWQDGYPFPVLVLAPAAEQPAPRCLKRLEHEYALAAELDPAWAAQPLALARQGVRPVLVLKDTGGEPLDSLVGK
ncbi:MAG TPA: hypothetical protein VGP06_10090, partial [Janthinobacterium sp.]|nr:hypothetical protein [Janthinobacterium sp.]